MGSPAVTALLDAVRAFTDAKGRRDLSDRITEVAERVGGGVRVLVAGDFKMGKSTLVNELVGTPVCPVDDDLSTAVPTLVRWAAAPEAWVVRPDAGDGAMARQPVALADVAACVSEQGDPAARRDVQLVEIGVPAAFLGAGVELIDTPGLGGLGSAQLAPTRAALGSADVVLFVSDAAQELTAPELAFLREACATGASVAEVVTKCDFHANAPRIIELDQGHVAAHGLAVTILATAAPLAERARRTGDRDLAARSGFGALAAFIERSGSRAARERTGHAVAEVLAVIDQLERAAAAERDAIDPSRAGEVLAELAEAEARADALDDATAGWQVLLEDGTTDLSADVDYELAGRLRDAGREADESIDTTDPADVWDDFAAWLEQRAVNDVAASFALLSSRAGDLAQRVGESFRAAEADVIGELTARTEPSAVSPIAPGSRLASARVGPASRGALMLEGSFSGMEAFSMVGGIVGLSLVNPLSLVLGLFMGRRALREEKHRQLENRREQARQTAHRYLDEVSFRATKELHDALRRVQRGLRDAFASRAAELLRSMHEARAAAERARWAHGAEAEKRRVELENDLAALTALRRQAEGLLAS